MQLVPSLDPEMAWQNAEKIAAEMLALVKGCAPHIQHQWAWAGVCNLLKMTAIRWVGLPVAAALWMVVQFAGCVPDMTDFCALQS
jgi:hypothetical protein